jgi:hypothetical protein
MGTRDSFPGVKRPGREADHSPPYNAEVKKMWSYTSTSQYAFIAWCSVKKKHSDNFTFTFALYILIKQDEMVGLCSKHGEMRNAYKIFVRKPEGKRPLGKHRRRWEDNIRWVSEK